MTTCLTPKLTNWLADMAGRFEAFPSAQDAQRPTYDDGKLWMLFVEKEIRQLISQPDYEQAGEAAGYFFQAVSLLKNRQFADAEAQISEGNRRVLRLNHPHAYLYARQFQLSAEALVQHKRQNYAGAFSQTLECIALNEHLVRLGCPSMVFRCLEQNINLSRIYGRRGEVAAERRIVNGLLRYLLFNDADAIWGTTYPKTYDPAQANYLTYVSEGTLKIYIAMVAGKLIEAAANVPTAEGPLYDDLLGNLGEFDTPTLERVVIYNWLYLKRTYLAGHIEEFITNLPDFLGDPYERRFDVLKLSLCQNLLHWLHTQQSSTQRTQLQHSIARFIDTKLIVKADQRTQVLGQYG
jgi:cellobiose-specific phosphotransferase system component IIA